MGKICGTVEKCVEKLWENCGTKVENHTNFPPLVRTMDGGVVEKGRLYTFFTWNCGKVPTVGVNNIFTSYRDKSSHSRSFAQFPHSLLL